jgi:predicted nucleic acid-binding protein
LSMFLLDTSYLITLMVVSRPNHDAANRYFFEILQKGMPLYVSTIALAEFQQKQTINDLPLRNLIVLPFNIDHAMKTGELLAKLTRDAGDQRSRFSDDVKMLAQASCESIPHVITEDESTLQKYAKRFSEAGLGRVQPIVLAHGFDAAWLNGGQAQIV